METLLRELGQSALRKQAASYSVPKRRYAADQTVFRIYKGVKTFDFSYEHNMLATGGKKGYKSDLFFYRYFSRHGSGSSLVESLHASVSDCFH